MVVTLTLTHVREEGDGPVHERKRSRGYGKRGKAVTDDSKDAAGPGYPKNATSKDRVQHDGDPGGHHGHLGGRHGRLGGPGHRGRHREPGPGRREDRGGPGHRGARGHRETLKGAGFPAHHGGKGHHGPPPSQKKKHENRWEGVTVSERSLG